MNKETFEQAYALSSQINTVSDTTTQFDNFVQRGYSVLVNTLSVEEYNSLRIDLNTCIKSHLQPKLDELNKKLEAL